MPPPYQDSTTKNIETVVIASNFYIERIGKEHVNYKGIAQFNNTIFKGIAQFNNTIFENIAYFSETIFEGKTSFNSTIFENRAGFYKTVFGNNTEFFGTSFKDAAQFSKAIFGDNTKFRETTFGNNTFFHFTTFGNNTSFNRTVFGKNTYFNSAKLQGVSFHKTDLTNVDITRSMLYGCIDKKEINIVCLDAEKQLTNFRGAINIKYMKYVYTDHSNSPTGINAVRKDLRDSGYDREANEVVYFVEHGLLQEVFKDSNATYLRQMAAYLKLALFEMTTEWGINPTKALVILACIIGFMSISYWIILLIIWHCYRDKNTDIGIDLVFPKPKSATIEGQLVIEDGMYITNSIFTQCGTELSTVPPYGPDRKNAIRNFRWGLLKHAIWFSILSSFHLGWRDLNVGNWLSRIQPKPYTYRPHGALRTISGIQSLLCIYLLVIWFLTTFGNLWG